LSVEEIPWWGKILLYASIAVAALLTVYYTVTGVLLGPEQQVAGLWQQQYQDFLNELIEYQKEDGTGGLTTTHMQVLAQKSKAMQQTEQTYQNIVGSLYAVLEDFAITFGAVAGAVFAVWIIAKWKAYASNNQLQTATGQSYIVICMLTDQLTANGDTVGASVLAANARTMFSTMDEPYMQSQISYYQSIESSLTGVELAYAQWIIEAYTIELTSIPTWLALLPT
jgi:hypothetical protein